MAASARFAAWSTNGGSCREIRIGESWVAFIAAGNGDYARCQRPPVGYTDGDLEAIAQKAISQLMGSPDARMIEYWSGPGRIANSSVSGRYVIPEFPERDYFGHPQAVWRRQEPFRCSVEIVLPDLDAEGVA